MFLSLGVIFIVGFIGGFIFEKIKLPKIIWYVLLGIILGSSVLGFIDESLMNISSYLRQIALVIILTRSGLSLDVKKLKEIGRPAILMCFIPATFEIVGISIFAPLIMDISIQEALLLGSVLAAVSPAIVVPRMIKLQEQNYGNKHHVPELIMAGASCDDIFVIVLFYTFKGLISSNTFSYWSILEVFTSIFFGLLLGLIVALILIFIYKRFNFHVVFKTILFLGFSFLMIGIENLFERYNITTEYHIGLSSLLGVILIGISLLKYQKEDAIRIKKNYDGLWNGFEILLFVLVGAALDVKYAFSVAGAKFIGLIFLALLFRVIGVLVSIAFTNFTLKEKIFIVISYLPKATVQASIGGIALAEGLACGSLILTGAVISILITAPLGSILMDLLYKKLLKQNEENLNDLKDIKI